MRWRWIVAGLALVAALVVAAALAANRVIDANRGSLLAMAEKSLGRPVEVGGVETRLFGRPGVRLSDVVVADDPAFGREPFVAARAASLRLRLWPLLEGRLELARVGLEEPAVRIVRAADGRFNYESLGGGRLRVGSGGDAGATPDSPGADTGGTGGESLAWAVALFDIEGGALTWIDRAAEPPRTIAVRGIDLRASDISLDEPLAFSLRAAVEAESENVDLEGEVGPLASRAAVPFAVRGALGPLPGWPERVEALDLRGFARPQSVDIEGLSAELFGGEIELHGTLPLVERGTLSITGDARGVDLEPLLAAAAPELNVAIAGRGDVRGDVQGVGNRWPELRESLRGNTSLDLRDGALRRFNLVAEVLRRITLVPELDRLLARSVKPKYAAVLERPDTRFDSLVAEARIVPGGIVVDRAAIDGEDFGATVSGRIDYDENADLRGQVRLSKRFSADIAADVREARLLFDGDGQISVPFTLRGKLGQAKPEIDAGRAAESLLKGDLGKALKNLFR